MTQIMGQVQSMSTRDTSFGTMHNVQVDGVWYGAGKFKPKCSEGDTVRFEAYQKGQYWNLQGKIEVLSSAPPEVQQQMQQSSQRAADTKQAHIEFQSSRATAAQLVQIIVQADKEKVGKEGWNAEAVVALHNQITWGLMDEINELDVLMAQRYEGEGND